MFTRRLLTPRIRYGLPLVFVTGAVTHFTRDQRRPLLLDSSSGRVWPAPKPRNILDLSNPPGQKETHTQKFEETGHELEQEPQDSTWKSFTSTFTEAGSSLSSIQWSSIGDKITDIVLPDWAQALPAYVRKLQLEIDMGPGSLANEIWQEAGDVDINPEIAWNAQVRVGTELCAEERAFLKRRKQWTTTALARYLNIPEDEINPEDVPTIAMCGSGGGLRALVAGTASYLSSQEAGLFDCVTYTAGVSGSCWLQSIYHSSIANHNFYKMVEHLKRRLGTHIAFPPAALQLLTAAPTNKFLLSGLVEKYKSNPDADFGIVDIYSILLAGRLLVPRGELGVNARDLKLSNQRPAVDSGVTPMPIYTAVRHEIPLEDLKTEIEDVIGPSIATREKAKQESYFQWFEFTPYEFWCEEFEAGIPTWAIGRKFENGINVPRENGLCLPELRVSDLMGIWGSAFCATLSHYYKEVRPLVQGLAGFTGLDDILQERDDELVRVHPIQPASIPNFALGMKDRLPATTPTSIHSTPHLQLMDAGMSNNLPIYPLLRPGRDVDILIAFDASADIKSQNWLSVADGYAKQRGVKGWPIGLGWPKEGASKEQTARELQAAQAATPQEAAVRVAEAQEADLDRVNETRDAVVHGKTSDPNQADLGYCTVWIGTTEERISEDEPPQSKRMNSDEDWELMSPDSGIAVIYFPLLPNDKVEGVDPTTSDFMSTWNFIYTPDEVEKVVALARANFEEGREQTKRCVRAVYDRKKKMRLERERLEFKKTWRSRLPIAGDHFL